MALSTATTATPMTSVRGKVKFWLTSESKILTQPESSSLSSQDAEAILLQMVKTNITTRSFALRLVQRIIDVYQETGKYNSKLLGDIQRTAIDFLIESHKAGKILPSLQDVIEKGHATWGQYMNKPSTLALAAIYAASRFVEKYYRGPELKDFDQFDLTLFCIIFGIQDDRITDGQTQVRDLVNQDTINCIIEMARQMTDIWTKAANTITDASLPPAASFKSCSTVVDGGCFNKSLYTGSRGGRGICWNYELESVKEFSSLEPEEENEDDQQDKKRPAVTVVQNGHDDEDSSSSHKNKKARRERILTRPYKYDPAANTAAVPTSSPDVGVGVPSEQLLAQALAAAQEREREQEAQEQARPPSLFNVELKVKKSKKSKLISLRKRNWGPWIDPDL